MTPGAAAASLAAAIVFEVVGTTALQASKGFTRLGPGLVTVAAYGLAVWLLGRALLAIPVGVAYAVWSGLGVVLIALVFVGPQTPWGWLGLIPLMTGLIGSCPVYTVLGVSTCSTKGA